jgi:hypothetical protein
MTNFINFLAYSVFSLLLIQQWIAATPIGVKYHAGAYIFFFTVIVTILIQGLTRGFRNHYKYIPLFFIVTIFYFIGYKFLIIILLGLYIATILNGIVNFSALITLITLISLFLSIFQVAGVHEIFHFFNSQYDENFILRDILFDYRETEFRSQQVRPAGILHSSGLLSQIYCYFIALLVLSYKKNLIGFFLIPFLIIFSGSKIVLVFSVIAIAVSLKNSFDFYEKFLPFILGLLSATVFHLTLFGNLLIKQFEFLMILQAIKFRLDQFLMLNIDPSDIFLGFIFLLVIFYYLYKPEKQRDSFYLLIIVLILTQITNYTFTTPIISVLYYGLIFDCGLIEKNKKYIIALSIFLISLISALWSYFPQV